MGKRAAVPGTTTLAGPSELSPLQEIGRFFQDVTLRDFFDVALVALCLYYLLLAIRGTRAVQILQGLSVLVFLLVLAHAARLQTLIWLLNGLLVSAAVAVPVVFQPELRRTLMRLGQQGLLAPGALRSLGKEELSQLIDEVAFAASNLSLARYGALVVLEQETGLEEIIETGQAIRGTTSAKLLQTIFHPKTPLHDGAVVVRGTDLVAAACYLPLTEQVVDARFGTRHRAALGITEQTDAVVVVVSEETGEVRIAHEGKFSRPLSEEADIRKNLNQLLVAEIYRGRSTRVRLPGAAEGT